jgi:hypothetical protein
VFRFVPGATLEVELSPAAGRIRAMVRDSQGLVFPAGVVVAARDRVDRAGSLWLTFGVADQNGVVELTGLRPGNYRLYAFDSFDQSMLEAFDYSHQKASTVEVKENGLHNLDLDLNEYRPLF